MRIEIQCPQCNHKYWLEAGALPAGGARVTCKACGYRWEARPLKGTSPAPGGEEASPARRSSAGAPVPGPGQSFISCPGCGLRFVVVSAAGGSPAYPPFAMAGADDAGQAPGPRGQTGVPATHASQAGSGKTILVVEDVEYFTALARNALGRKYRTITVANVADALKVINNEPIDLLVLDLTLQKGEDGRQVLRSLQKKNFPVLIFTARDENDMYGDVWKELQRLGADDMLIKGMNVEEDLLLKVGTLLSRP